MNNTLYNNITRFVILVLVQVLICNHINFLGYINPYPYVLFILLFPVKNNRMTIIFLSFLLGLTIDMFQDSGGVHAAASVCIAYIRPLILKSTFGMMYEHQTIKFDNVEYGSKFTYISIMTLIHHFIMFSLEIFNASKIILVLQKTLFSSIFTILLSILATIIFSRKK
ncbi:rod shape-determining protein MreD [Aestuariibaculum sediminum]|uniref:Rod shape-determining protein MreD n=1 Tax=Aestuariibaculum sediminum TaxID=2770637 RepID=A0A8J6QJI2_9FLAO|nr:rod shape-determining protein MreD [Aestuariibaculum sediminum]MBD0832854.1 rod shape-determining protein MreD [Aestuariibaculum sediminum]